MIRNCIKWIVGPLFVFRYSSTVNLICLFKSGATIDDANLTKQLLGSVGLCELIPESQQNAFTGLAASGPAYIYTILEGLADGGVRCGLPRNVAIKMAAQMTLGAAKMSLDSG